MENDNKRKSIYRPVIRILAVVLVFCFALSAFLSWQSQIRYAKENYVNTILEYASDVTAANTAYLTESRLDRAITVLKTLVRKPKTYDDYDRYASLYIAREDYPNAIESLQGCIDHYAGGSETELAGLYLRQGSLYILTQDYAAAIPLFTEALRLEPQLADAYILRAQMAYELGDTEQAIADMKAYASLSGNQPAIQSSIGQLYESIEDYAHAIECYTRAIDSTDAPDPELFYSRARCYVVLEDNTAADADLERYIAANGADEDGTASALLCYYRGSRGDYAGALEMGKQALENGYADPASVYSQCVLYAYFLEDYAGAAEYAHKAIMLNELVGTGSGELYHWAAICEMAVSDYENASADFRAAIDADSAIQDAKYNLAVCLMAQEKYEEALEWYTASIEAEENVTAAIYARGVCYLVLGDTEPGISDLNLVIERNDDESLTAEAQELLATASEE